MRNIIEKTEKQRGCGYRKPGGMYFVSSGSGMGCCKLPFPLHVCPTCSGGIKQSRGFTWVNSDLFKVEGCTAGNASSMVCPMNRHSHKVGLMWVGTKFYPTTTDFNNEAFGMGISKRIAQIPKDFKIGEDWIFLAHPRAITKKFNTEEMFDYLTNGGQGHQDGDHIYTPGIFRAFQPTAIEYVVKGDETDEELDRLEKRGLTLVKVIPVIGDDASGSMKAPEPNFGDDEKYIGDWQQ